MTSTLRFIFITLILLVAAVWLLQRVGAPLVREISQTANVLSPAAPEKGGLAGQPAPAFALADGEGKITRLGDVVGAPLVIVFWASWNDLALDQLQIADEYARKRGGPEAMIIAISSQEDASVVKTLLRRGGYQLQVLLDGTGAVGEAYRARTLPATYFIGADGVIREVFRGVLSEEMLRERIARLASQVTP